MAAVVARVLQMPLLAALVVALEAMVQTQIPVVPEILVVIVQ